MKIFTKHEGTQRGPFTEAEMHDEVAAGRISAESLIWWEGQADWIPCAHTPFIRLQTRQSTPPAVYLPRPVSTVPAPAQPSQVPIIIFRESPSIPSTMNATIGGSRGSGMAMASLVCGLLSFFFFIPCIAAIVLGHLARGAIRKDPSLTGKGMATSGLVIGYIIFLGGVISTLALLCGGALLAILAAASQPQH